MPAVRCGRTFRSAVAASLSVDVDPVVPASVVSPNVRDRRARASRNLAAPNAVDQRLQRITHMTSRCHPATRFDAMLDGCALTAGACGPREPTPSVDDTVGHRARRSDRLGMSTREKVVVLAADAALYYRAPADEKGR